ncbi:splicing factor-like protein 1 [Kryptolebias marmoratus]|uniref:splicing factor-like protein 1 n=1 Tax=Kryptolebias marmoratus TaxID=37003 RepID=UPI0007F8D3DE|nr:splicing factor-like protein 1 [Kryptolebias marmoratus]
MMTLQVFLGVSLCALLILGTHGFPTKGSKSHDQSSSGTDTGGHYSSYAGGAGGYYAPMSYGPSKDVSQYVPTGPAAGSVSHMAGAGYPGGAVFMPVPVGYASSAQTDAAQSNPPETKWSVAPKIFSEEGLANTEAVHTSPVLPPAPPPPPPAPVLQSGETSNVVKEAELGNYQHETEEFGYPAHHMGPGYGFASYPAASPPLPSVGGFWGYPGLYPYPYPYPYPSPVFDYRLLYGLYPPGTYTTFSKNHEKGKDYYQSIHYLKEHGSGPSDDPTTPGGPGSGQQQNKIFPRGPQSS